MTEQGQNVIDRIKLEFKTGDEIGYSVIQRKFSLGYNLAYKVISELKSTGNLKETKFSHLGMWTFNCA